MNFTYKWLNWIPSPGHSEFVILNALMKGISPDAEPITPASLTAFIEDQGWESIMICENGDGHTVGMGAISLKFQINRRIGCIDHVSVDPMYRRQGIGTEIVKRLIKQGYDLGVSRFDLVTENPDAIKFYQKLGFTYKAKKGVFWLERK